MKFFKILLFRTTVYFFVIMTFSGCRHKVTVMKSPPHYNFSVVYEDKLDLKLKEISGIVWDSKNNEFLAHNDETGNLYSLDRETKIIKEEIHFGEKGDYEDIAMANGIPFVLRSDGMLIKIIKDSVGKYYGLEAGKIGISGKNDFESLYYDAGRKALIMVCKNCAMDDKTSVSAFAYYPDSLGFDNKPVFTINAEEVKKLSPVKTSKIQPSAIAVHPILHKLFIVSSASNLLVIADLDGNPEFAFYLSKKLFPQAEGITFKNNGDMYISNEGVASRGTLLKFIYKP